MPGRKAIRGRGGPPGRGRGRAIEPAEDDQPPPRVAPQANMREPNEAEESLPNPEPMDVDPSPNSSPVTIPTETPAPTPARPAAPWPVLPPGQASSSLTTTTTSKTASGQTPAATAAAPSKFKPKAIRRTKDERDRLVADEFKRAEKAKADAKREAERASRGRGRGARGRGDAMGRPKEAPRSTAHGIFGITPEEMGMFP